MLPQKGPKSWTEWREKRKRGSVLDVSRQEAACRECLLPAMGGSATASLTVALADAIIVLNLRRAVVVL
jgi:hypothetical protein